MKLNEIKKELGNKGKLVWIEPENNTEGFSLVFHPNSEVKYGYDPDILYDFEKFVNCDGTDSFVIRAIKEAFGVDKVFAFQETAVTTDSLEESNFTKLGKNRYFDFYDSFCSYLVLSNGKENVVGNKYNGVTFLG